MEEPVMKVSIIGASGYAGEELIRLLHGHPHTEIVHLTSERHTGEKISKTLSTLNAYL